MNSFPNKALRFCKILGGLPMECTLGADGTKTLKFSFTGFLWITIWFILLEVSGMMVLYSYFKDRLGGHSLHPLDITTDFAISFDTFCRQTVVAIAFISYAWKYPRLVKVFDTLERAHRDFQYETSKVKLRVLLWGIVIFVALSAMFTEKVVSVIKNIITLKLAVSSTMRFMSVFSMYCCGQGTMIVHFTIVNEGIARNFRMINTRIENEITNSIIERRETSRTLRNPNVTNTSSNTLSTISKLQSLMDTYWLMCDAVHQANAFYSNQLMAVTFSSFVYITMTSYYFFVNVNAGKVFSVLSNASWLMVHVGYVILLTNSCTEVTNSADDTEQMMNKFINKNLDPIVRKQLEGFLLQLPHHNARFSAHEFFPIQNNTLIVMAVTVTTYLVIMIQFETQT